MSTLGNFDADLLYYLYEVAPKEKHARRVNRAAQLRDGIYAVEDSRGYCCIYVNRELWETKNLHAFKDEVRAECFEETDIFLLDGANFRPQVQGIFEALDAANEHIKSRSDDKHRLLFKSNIVTYDAAGFYELMATAAVA
ncbi:MAG: hypothetical protein RL094_648 [Candidatus Parcubacteria bacterium]